MCEWCQQEKPHRCARCEKTFARPGDLKAHEHDHDDDWPYRCGVCARGFAKLTNLRKHEITHTGLHLLTTHSHIYSHLVSSAHYSNITRIFSHFLTFPHLCTRRTNDITKQFNWIFHMVCSLYSVLSVFGFVHSKCVYAFWVCSCLRIRTETAQVWTVWKAIRASTQLEDSPENSSVVYEFFPSIRFTLFNFSTLRSLEEI